MHLVVDVAEAAENDRFRQEWKRFGEHGSANPFGYPFDECTRHFQTDGVLYAASRQSHYRVMDH